MSEEGRIALQISLSERGVGPTHLDKLKPYVLENIVVLLVLPSPEDAVCMSICTFINIFFSFSISHFWVLNPYLLSAADTCSILVIFKGALSKFLLAFPWLYFWLLFIYPNGLLTLFFDTYQHLFIFCYDSHSTHTNKMEILGLSSNTFIVAMGI